MSEYAPRLRYAIIGVAASVLGMHRPGLALDEVDVVAACDIDTKVGRGRATEYGCPFYSDYGKMLAEAKPDVTVILTPHPLHAQMTIDALEVGSHVLVEKPMAVQAAEADAMIDAAVKTQRLLTVSFQQRFRPEIAAARRLLRQGTLGEIQHVDMVVVWPRTGAYYAQATWRGTWDGEGGGVLMNQAPHNLDLLCHLLGAPKRVAAWTRNLLHPIPVEDTVQAMLEWGNGALGSVHISTAEAGVDERLEIVGTKGVLQIFQGAASVMESTQDLRQFVIENQEPFATPNQREIPVELSEGVGNHLAVYNDLHAAIFQGKHLLTDGEEARMSLELANAMILSSYTDSSIALPLDRQAYADLLGSLQAKHGA